MDLKILIVDAIPAQVRALENVLKQAGYEKIVQARSVKEAIAAVGTDPEIGLVISEWDLSSATGLEILKAMKMDGRMEKIPVLLTFKDKSRDEILKALKLGARGFIVKPYKLDTVRQKIAGIAVAAPAVEESNEALIKSILKHDILE